MAKQIDIGSPFRDIYAKDPRYAVKAYMLLFRVLQDAATAERSSTLSGANILKRVVEEAKNYFGPFTSFVLKEWGILGAEDLGEMIVNLDNAGYLNFMNTRKLSFAGLKLDL